MKVDLEMPVPCKVKKRSVNTLMYFTSQAVKQSRKLMFQNRLPDIREVLQIRISDYKHIKIPKNQKGASFLSRGFSSFILKII